jgi:hypothetical protein
MRRTCRALSGCCKSEPVGASATAAYILGVPVLRSVAFLAGFATQMSVAVALL